MVSGRTGNCRDRLYQKRSSQLDFHDSSAEFVTKEVFDWAITEASEKKQTDFSSVEFFPFHEGFCIQCMHIGPYDDEPATILQMNQYAEQHGCLPDLSASRLHHKIYLSDPSDVRPSA